MSCTDEWYSVFGCRLRDSSPKRRHDGCKEVEVLRLLIRLWDDSKEPFSPCPNTPHTGNWKAMEKKLRKRKQGSGKALDYLCLHAAKDWCVDCVSHCINEKCVDPACTSGGQSARQTPLPPSGEGGYFPSRCREVAGLAWPEKHGCGLLFVSALKRFSALTDCMQKRVTFIKVLSCFAIEN